MAETEVRRIREIINAVLEAIARALQDVDAMALRDYDVNDVFAYFCNHMLEFAGIKLLSINVSKQALITGYSKREWNMEVVPVLRLREITRNTRLIVEAVTRSEKLQHHLQMVFYVDADRRVSLEGEPWIDISRNPRWTDRTKSQLEEAERRLRPYVPYAFARLLETIIGIISKK
jgi:hypothetical protein